MSTTLITEFKEEFNKLTTDRSRQTTWADFIEMSACTISNAVDKRHRDEREKRYLEIAEKYNAAELQSIRSMFHAVVGAIDKEPARDFLGSACSELDVGKVFTSPETCAELQFLQDSEIKSPVRVCESASGSGGTLIAFMAACRKRGIDYKSDVIFSATDADRTSALMCYIQMSLLGCAGVVSVEDAQHLENYSAWHTPSYFSGVWTTMRKIEAAKNLIGIKEAVGEKLKGSGCKCLFNFNMSTA